MLLLGKIMILQGVGHPISCLGVCYANDPKKGGYMTPAPALDLTTSLRGDFCMFWRSSLPVRGISSCGIEAPSNLAPHLEQLRMLALWGRLWSRLGFSHVVMVSTPGLNSRRRQLLAVPARPEWHNTAASATPCATLRDPPYGVLWCASQESSTRQHNKSLIGGTIGAFRSGRRVAEGAELLPGTAATFNS